MTATLVARCVEAGQVAWTDTVGGVLGGAIPDMRAEYRDVTLPPSALATAPACPGTSRWRSCSRFPRESADARADRVAYARLGLHAGAARPEGADLRIFQHRLRHRRRHARSQARRAVGDADPASACSPRSAWPAPGRARRERRAPTISPSATRPARPPSQNGQQQRAARPVPAGRPDHRQSRSSGPAGRVHANFEDVFKYLAAHRDQAAPFLRRASWEALHTPPFGGAVRHGLGAARRHALAQRLEHALVRRESCSTGTAASSPPPQPTMAAPATWANLSAQRSLGAAQAVA